MSENLTDTQIALLCAIEEWDLPRATADEKRDLEQLASKGYVAPAEKHTGAPFKLTAKAVAFLRERGAGLNEA
jgi:hypothetical protein